MWLVGCVPPPRPSRLSLLLCVSVSVPCSLIHLHCFSFCLILLAWGAPQGGGGSRHIIRLVCCFVPDPRESPGCQLCRPNDHTLSVLNLSTLHLPSHRKAQSFSPREPSPLTVQMGLLRPREALDTVF